MAGFGGSVDCPSGQGLDQEIFVPTDISALIRPFFGPVRDDPRGYHGACYLFRHCRLRLTWYFIIGGIPARLQMVASIVLLVFPDVERKLDTVAQTLFIENAADVALHRSEAEVKFGGDLFVRQPARDRLGDAPFRVR